MFQCNIRILTEKRYSLLWNVYISMMSLLLEAGQPVCLLRSVLRNRSKTLLIERNAYLGGEATHSGGWHLLRLLPAEKNPVRVVCRGVGQLVLDEMGRGARPWTMSFPRPETTMSISAQILKMCDGQSVGKRTYVDYFCIHTCDQCEGGTWIHCFYSGVPMMREAFTVMAKPLWMHPEMRDLVHRSRGQN